MDWIRCCNAKLQLGFFSSPLQAKKGIWRLQSSATGDYFNTSLYLWSIYLSVCISYVNSDIPVSPLSAMMLIPNKRIKVGPVIRANPTSSECADMARDCFQAVLGGTKILVQTRPGPARTRENNYF